jgi:hypothetical protein
LNTNSRLTRIGSHNTNVFLNMATQSFIEQGGVRILCAELWGVKANEAVHKEIWRAIDAVGYDNTCLVLTKIDVSKCH